MGIRLLSISLSRYTVLVATQLIVNVSLAVWLYNEYLHNPFMQLYLSNAWSTIWPEFTVAIAVALGALAILAAYQRGMLPLFEKDEGPIGTAVPARTTANLSAIDVCPFCDLPLKTLSEGRLQCRGCRRYFKSSMPKVSA